MRREVTSKEFLTINRELVEVKFYRREVPKVIRERAEVVDKWRELVVFQGPQLTLSRTVSKMGLSTPSSQDFQSLVGFNYFLLHKGAP